jgi:sensor histidine kinase YesM
MASDSDRSVMGQRFRETGRAFVLWVGANTAAGVVVGAAIAFFSEQPGAVGRLIGTSVLLANAIGFATVFSARFLLPRYSELPKVLGIPLAVVTLLAGGAFGTLLVVLFYPLSIFYQGRLLLLLIVVCSVIAAIVGLIIYTYERMRDEVEASYRAAAEDRVRAEKLRELAARSELKALKAQINPHFLFNALNSISALIPIDPATAERTVERLAGIFRGSLLASEKETIPLGQELDLINAYLDIERARFGNRLAVTQHVSDEARGRPVPPLIVQPIVENAVRHGVSPLIEGGRISITAGVENGRLRVVVEDDGAGWEGESGEELFERGYGLRNVRDRLRNRYGERRWVRIDRTENGGTRVELTLPAEKEPDEGGTA